MRQCVAYIHDPYKTLTFDLKVKFVGCFPCLRVQPITSVYSGTGNSFLVHASVTMTQRVAYIHDPGTTLIFDLNVNL